MTDRIVSPAVAPLVTIGITVCNAADTLERAVASAKAQDWPNCEIVVVDDASTDGSWAHLQRLAKADSGMRIYRLASNQGVATARNRILAEAQGAFIAFFDDDDESAPDRIRAQITEILAYERTFAKGAPVMCHTARRQLFPDGREQIQVALGQTRHGLAPQGAAVARRILMGEAVDHAYGATATCSQMARRSTYALVGGFDPALRRSEDTDIVIRLALVGAHFVGLTQPLVTQVMTPTNEKTTAQERANMLMVLAKNRDLIAAHDDYDFTVKWLHFKFDMRAHSLNTVVLRLIGLFWKHPHRTARRVFMAAPRLGGSLSERRFRRSIPAAIREADDAL